MHYDLAFSNVLKPFQRSLRRAQTVQMGDTQFASYKQCVAGKKNSIKVLAGYKNIKVLAYLVLNDDTA